MTIAVHSLTGASYVLPFYKHMPLGIFLTHIAAPALGCRVEKNGDVYDLFLHKREPVFTRDNRNKIMGDVFQDGAVLHYSICFGPVDQSLKGNGNLSLPSKYQLTLLSSEGDGKMPVCKKRRLEF